MKKSAKKMMTDASVRSLSMMTACQSDDDDIPMPQEVGSQRVFDFFKGINAVPRPSGHEEQMRQYLIRFADARGLRHAENNGNIIIYKDATAGMEQVPSVVLQTHMDMVCVAADGYAVNFLTQGIEQEVTDGFIHSRGHKTSLGADDGIGISLVLAVLDSKMVKHGPLECLFTWDEEQGLEGAAAFDSGILKSKYMINIDSETEGETCIGTSGGVWILASMDYTPQAVPAGYTACVLSVNGLTGGHSGIDIYKGGASATKLLADFLYSEKTTRLRLVSINGGQASNSIATSATAVVIVPEDNAGTLVSLFESYMAEAKTRYAATDPAMTWSSGAASDVQSYMPAEAAELLVNGLDATPQGVIERSTVVENMFETANNIGIITTTDGRWEVVNYPRGFDAAKIDAVSTTISQAFSGATVEFANPYLPWNADVNCALIAYTQKSYQGLFGTPLRYVRMGGGIEASQFALSYPEMQIISIGSNVFDAHTVNERVEIASVERTWKFVLRLLGNIGEVLQ